jgi:putative ABC transport system substrate-binding protein
MRRREFITSLASTAVLRPLAARAQQPKLPTIGWLSNASHEGNLINDGILKELQRLGWLEGRTASYERRFSAGDPTRMPALAAALAARKVDVIIASSREAARAAQEATATIPIVALADDMQGSGLVQSFAHPGRNTTGVSIFTSELEAKRLALLVEMIPTARRIAVLLQSKAVPSVPQIVAAARELGVDLVFFETRSRDEIGAAIDTTATAAIDGVIVLTSSILYVAHGEVLERLAATRLPAIYPWPEYASEGALMGYGPRQALISELIARLVDRVLRGAPVADLPVMQPTKFELIINLKTAKALGLAVPASLLARADELIE